MNALIRYIRYIDPKHNQDLSLKVIDYLLKELKLDINSVDKSGSSAIYWAVGRYFKTHPSYVEALLARGANPNLKFDKETLVSLARNIIEDKQKTTELLILILRFGFDGSLLTKEDCKHLGVTSAKELLVK